MGAGRQQQRQRHLRQRHPDQPALLGPSDIVGIGHQLLHLSGDRLVEYVDTGDISYEAANLRVVTNKGSKKSKVLLADVSFALPSAACWRWWGPAGPVNPRCWGR
ncbi:putative ABC transporter ATP-binding domain protein [Mycobacterium kansasii 662]|uniref:Putative ABC transporter ATP-binding domain protein n=1 Tax=Mycobacterium kansasii 662 TaxID=1299326 RepID=X7XWD5_MYCKA|nr:putative ABC transporter ATP-binding domain protein [Mycobacterium kansasii 662]